MKKYHDNTLKVLNELAKVLKDREIENNIRTNNIEDELESEIYYDVMVLRNDRFEIKYSKKNEKIEFLTTYSNLKIDRKFMDEITELNNLVHQFEVRIENIKAWNKLQKEEESSDNNISDELIEVETVEEHMDKKEQLIKESKKTPNYKKIFNNGLRTKKIYYKDGENGIELKNGYYASKSSMIEDMLLMYNGCKSNIVFINKEKEIIERDFYKNNNDYTFTKVQ
jgi:hypothetical protein